MKKENIERVNALVQYIDELDLVIKSFEPGTASGKFIPATQFEPAHTQDSDEPLLSISLAISAKGNTTGNEAQQRFNGSAWIMKDCPCEEYSDMLKTINLSVTELYLTKCKELKKQFEKELEFL